MKRMKKEHQVTKRNLMQTFSKLINENGGISVERLNIISKTLLLPENTLNDCSDLIQFLKNRNDIVESQNTTEYNTNTEDFTSKTISDALKDYIADFKTLNTEIGAFTIMDIINVFKAKLKGEFPTIEIEVKEFENEGNSYKLKLNNEYEFSGKNLCDCLAILLIRFSKIKTETR